MNVKITVRPYEVKSHTKAFVELKLDDHFIVKGLTLVEGKKGLFLSFPAYKGKDNKFYNSVYSLDKEWVNLLEEACLKKYNEKTENKESKNGGAFS